MFLIYSQENPAELSEEKMEQLRVAHLAVGRSAKQGHFRGRRATEAHFHCDHGPDGGRQTAHH